jgi:hypothetical protein
LSQVIPAAFIKLYGNDVGKTAILQGPGGQVWQVGIGRPKWVAFCNFKGKTKGYVTNVVPIRADVEAASIKDISISSCKLLRAMSTANFLMTSLIS